MCILLIKPLINPLNSRRNLLASPLSPFTILADDSGFPKKNYRLKEIEASTSNPLSRRR
jgi:hypothetical protein